VNPKDLAGIISNLRSRRDQIDEAIRSLERLAALQPKRRGRPPKWLAKERVDIERKSGTNGQVDSPAIPRERLAKADVAATGGPQ
jgi:hypothetical protein